MFKDLKDKVFGIINLNDEAKKYVESIESGDLLDSDFCQKVVECTQIKYGVDYTYGGWMENRSYLWKGSYLENSGNFIHLGVDYNVPAGTKVYSEYDMEVVHVENDAPLVHGWGTYLVGYIKEKDVCILYGHLSKNIKWKTRDRMKAGEVIGFVGDKNDNGFWFPHLHVQCISKEYFDYVYENDLWKEFDGYGHVNDLQKISKIYRDPMNYLGLN